MKLKDKLYCIWFKRFKYKLGNYRFIFMWNLGEWYLPLHIRFPNYFGDMFWNDYGIGILCFYLEFSNKNSVWTQIMWKE